MASLIPGYEYDIFISYRQKDNKHDRRISEFSFDLSINDKLLYYPSFLDYLKYIFLYVIIVLLYR